MSNKNYPTSFYNSWNAMKKRCTNSKYEYYHRYGGRGITYDSKWDEIEGFAEDMLDSWEEGLTLDRENVDGNYCKENCRWITIKEQAYNRSTNRYIEINGITMTLTEWSEKSGIAITTILHRYNRGVRGSELIDKNERPVSAKQSGVEGIIWNKSKQRWLVNQKVDGKKKCLGSFKEDELELAKECLAKFKTGE
jgi:hypothetical protein